METISVSGCGHIVGHPRVPAHPRIGCGGEDRTATTGLLLALGLPLSLHLERTEEKENSDLAHFSGEIKERVKEM